MDSNVRCALPGIITIGIVSDASMGRWTAPERLEDDRSTTFTDVYAFGMTLLEVLTGDRPFRNLPTQNSVIIAISNGERPELPSPLSPLLSHYIGLIKSCWRKDRFARPDMKHVIAQLNWLAASYPGTLGSHSPFVPVSIGWPQS